jgi:hypothetical protein
MVGYVTGSQGTHISFPLSEGRRRSSHCPDAVHLQQTAMPQPTSTAVTQRSAAQIETLDAFLTFNDFPQFLQLNNGLQTKSTLRDMAGFKFQPMHSTATCKLKTR